MWMLDTSICSFILKRRPPSIQARLESLPEDQVGVSTIVAAELRYGVARHPERTRIGLEVEDLLARLAVLPWDDAAARSYGDLRADLERKGTPIGGMDLLIAAHGLALDAVVVTNNRREFDRVPGLQIEDWLEGSRGGRHSS
jgi:tRNA(fMet)-specific endonuclease VapC